jgi:hypothetical protein
MGEAQPTMPNRNDPVLESEGRFNPKRNARLESTRVLS